MKANKTNKQKAYQYFKEHTSLKKFVLHHIDVDMKQNDPIRYAEWRIEDLVPMTIKDHMRLHMMIRHHDTDKMKRTKKWNANVSKSLYQHNYFQRAGKKWRLVNPKGKMLKRIFTKPTQISEYLDCSKQTVYRILNDNYPNKTVFGYSIVEVA